MNPLHEALPFGVSREAGKVRLLLSIILVGIGTGGAFLDSVGNAASSRFGEGELARLTQGEVVVSVNQPDPEQRARVKAAILIDSPTPHVWNIMIDCEQAPDFVPGLRSCRVVRHEENSDIIEHRVKFSWYLPTITYRFRAQYRGLQKIEFTRVEGDLRELEGSWTLKQVDDGRKTIVVYSVYVDAGFLVPQWLVRRILRGNLPDLLLALRKRVSELSKE